VVVAVVAAVAIRLLEMAAAVVLVELCKAQFI
jgi:hypothetical protein